MAEGMMVAKYDGKKFVGLRNICCEDVIDSSVPLPELLINLYQAADVQNDVECLVVLLHVLMIEAGYLPTDQSKEKWKEKMPEKWRNHGVYKLCYNHKDCPDILCQMSCIPLGTLLATHATIVSQESEANISIMLRVQSYVNNTKGYQDPASVYHDVSQLASYFKCSFAAVLLQEMYYVSEVEPAIGLSNLPSDVQFYILSFLPAKCLVVLSAVNKEFHAFANSRFLWKPLYLRDFPDDLPSNTSEHHNWKELYANEYTKRKKAKEQSLKCLNSYNHERFYPSERFSHFPPPLYTPPEILFPYRRDVHPEIQEAFPYLARRFLPSLPSIFRPNHPFFE